MERELTRHGHDRPTWVLGWSRLGHERQSRLDQWRTSQQIPKMHEFLRIDRRGGLPTSPHVGLLQAFQILGPSRAMRVSGYPTRNRRVQDLGHSPLPRYQRAIQP